MSKIAQLALFFVKIGPILIEFMIGGGWRVPGAASRSQADLIHLFFLE